MEAGAALGIIDGPEAAVVFLDDGVADGEAHAHAGGFGGEEGLEDAAELVGAEAGAGIGNGGADGFRGFGPGANGKESFLGVLGEHGVDGVDDEVEDDLLEFDQVAHDGGEIGVEVQVNADVFEDEFAVDQFEAAADDVVKLKGDEGEFAFLEERAEALDDGAGAAAVGLDVGEGIEGFV